MDMQRAAALELNANAIVVDFVEELVRLEESFHSLDKFPVDIQVSGSLKPIERPGTDFVILLRNLLTSNGFAIMFFLLC